MTTPTPSPSALYDEVCASIVKAVPEIVKLTFGCLLKPKVGSCTFMVLAEDKDFVQVFNTFASQYETFHRDGNQIEWVWKKKGGNQDIVTFDDRFTIIGRPITLEDVLKALNNSSNYPRIDWCLNEQIEFAMPRFFVERDIYSARWHLGQPLSWLRDNAPETIAFLHSLLKP